LGSGTLLLVFVPNIFDKAATDWSGVLTTSASLSRTRGDGGLTLSDEYDLGVEGGGGLGVVTDDDVLGDSFEPALDDDRFSADRGDTVEDVEEDGDGAAKGVGGGPPALLEMEVTIALTLLTGSSAADGKIGSSSSPFEGREGQEASPTFEA